MRSVVPASTILLFALVCLPAPATAQFSLRGGVNLVDFLGDDVVESDSRPRLAGGVGFDVVSLGPVTLAPELWYAQKGAENIQSTLAEQQVAEISLSYIEVPVLLRLDVPLGGVLRPYVAAGPVFGWQLDCAARIDAGGAEQDCDPLFGTQDQLEDTLREYEQGLMAGAGLALQIMRGLGAVTLDARYAWGLSRLSDAENGPEVRNEALSLMLGYRFGFGGGGQPRGATMPF